MKTIYLPIKIRKSEKQKKDVFWLGDCYDKTVKVNSPFLYHLPNNKQHKFIFMIIEMKAVLASQRKMLGD